jgi:hypothetical protein
MKVSAFLRFLSSVCCLYFSPDNRIEDLFAGGDLGTRE